LKFLILLPEQPDTTGNAVTAERLRQGLASRGHGAELLTVTPDSSTIIAHACNRLRPNAVLLLHAFRSGAPWLAAAQTIPVAVLLTGTDVHEGLNSDDQAATILQVLDQAGAILLQNPQALKNLSRTYPHLSHRLYYLPPGIRFGTAPYELRKSLGLASSTLVFFHPAGIRPVKGNLELLHIFKALADEPKPFHLAFCGPILDPEYGRSFLAEVRRTPWASYLGQIPPEAMPAALRQADVILNNSRSEGLSNALVEAATLGRPILATAISGNQAVVQEGINGFCCATSEELIERARHLLYDEPLRQALSRPAPERFHPDKERDILEDVLLKLCTTRAG
jgi:L-malate glycosyltransferase